MIIAECIVGGLVPVSLNPLTTNSSINATILAFICIYVAGFAWSW